MLADRETMPEIDGFWTSDDGLVLRALACGQWVNRGDLANRTGLQEKTVKGIMANMNLPYWNIQREVMPSRVPIWLMGRETAARIAACHGALKARLEATPDPLRGDARQTLKLICEAYGVTLELLRSAGRRQELIQARHAAAAALRAQGLSTPRIGRILGRDHTTILHMLGRVAKGAKQ